MLGRIKWILAFAIVIGAAVYLVKKTDMIGLTVEGGKSINATPEQIAHIRNIRQWEFLSIDTEEYIDSMYATILGTNSIVRIYRGRLSLGIDMERASTDWFSAVGDTAFVSLPDISLLDENFLHEASATTFYEKGSWSGTDLAAFAERAKARMKERCLTEDNILQAKRQAEKRFKELFEAFGYKAVVVGFGD